MSAPHARTDADALLPAEREMTAAQWAEYGGLPTVLRGYCHLLMKREADARLRERQAELEVAEWRERTARLLTRAKAAEAALAAARAEVAQANAEGEAYRSFAASVAYEVHPDIGGVLANHLDVVDLPDLMTSLRERLAQAHADRALMAGLWLATAPPDVLPALLPADPGDRDRLAAALDAVDLQASAGSHTAAGRAIIARVVAAAGGAR